MTRDVGLAGGLAIPCWSRTDTRRLRLLGHLAASRRPKRRDHILATRDPKPSDETVSALNFDSRVSGHTHATVVAPAIRPDGKLIGRISSQPLCRDVPIVCRPYPAWRAVEECLQDVCVSVGEPGSQYASLSTPSPCFGHCYCPCVASRLRAPLEQRVPWELFGNHLQGTAHKHGPVVWSPGVFQGCTPT